MRKILPSIVIVVSMIICVFTTVKTTRKCNNIWTMITENPEALSYTNEGPGPQGQRQKQAVWCGGVGGWVVREGCCYGPTQCTYIYCPEHSFSCDGNTWIYF